MFNLHLTAEQLEFRDTVRDFVQNEVKPAAIASQAARAVRKAAARGPARLRVAHGAAHALAVRSGGRRGRRHAHLVHRAGRARRGRRRHRHGARASRRASRARCSTSAMSDAQRSRFLARFTEDHGYHLALAAHDGSGRRLELPPRVRRRSGRRADGREASERRLGHRRRVRVSCRTRRSRSFSSCRREPIREDGATAHVRCWCRSDTAGLTVASPARRSARRGRRTRSPAGITARAPRCGSRIAACPRTACSARKAQSPLGAAFTTRAPRRCSPRSTSGVGRAAYDAAVDYAKIRVQGGRPIIEHQAIGTHPRRHRDQARARAQHHLESGVGGSTIPTP